MGQPNKSTNHKHQIMKEKTCEECGAKISDQENSGTNGHPICGLCFDELHTPQIDEFSDADNGL